MVRPASQCGAPSWLSGALSPQFWGSPLFRADGTLAGVLVAAPEGETAAVPLAAVSRLLNGD